MSHITLIRPPAVYSKNCYSISLVPPLGVAYLAGALVQAGHRVGVIDAVGEAPERSGPTNFPELIHYGLSNEEIVERIHPESDSVAISAMFTVQWPYIDDLIRKIAQRFPGLPIIVGGEHATAAWNFCLESNPHITAVGIGEGEETMLDWVAYCQGNIKLNEIRGIALIHNDSPVKTPARDRIRSIDDLAQPAWNLLPLRAYHRPGFTYGIDGGATIPILATRGCPYQCSFCSSPQMWTTRYVYRSPALVVDEIAEYVEQYQISNVSFFDLTAIIKKDWILAFCDELKKRELDITFQLPTGTRSEVLDPEVLAALYKSGCRNICYAPESGSPQTLKRIKKKVKIDRITASMKTAKALNMVVKANLIIGFPDETRKDIYRTIWFGSKLAWLGIDDIPLFPFSPYPGTEYYEKLLGDGRIASPSLEQFSSMEYTGFFACDSYCEHVGTLELRLLQFFGMSLFIFVGYLRRPFRFIRTIKNLAVGRGATVTEQRIIDIASRVKMRFESPGVETVG